MDLDLMTGEASFGVCRINRIYDRTTWRPTRVFWGDCYNSQNEPDVLHHVQAGYDCYFNQRVVDQLLGRIRVANAPHLSQDWEAKVLPSLPGQVSTYSICSEHAKDNPPLVIHPHAAQGMYCRHGGTLQVALAHAIEEGYSPIYLVGVDLGLAENSPTNYFDPDYQVFPSKQDQLNSANTMWKYMHGRARVFCDEIGTEIYNAGVGGSLEAYERVELESLFS
jgi:hypothetical protein